MATVINNPGNRDDSGGGWAVAIIILLVILAIGAYLWTKSSGPTVVTPATNYGTTGSGSGAPTNNTINVSLPGAASSSASTTTRLPY